MKKHITLTSILLACLVFFYFFPKEKELGSYELTYDLIEVKVEGAVLMPGTYKIEKGKTLGYLIHLAGGLLKEADINQIDVKKIVYDTYYFIPSYELIDEEVVKKLNINQATYDELMNIPYLNNDKVIEILIYKKQHQKFIHMDELINIKGIGEKTLEKLKKYLTV